jgi:hypothetical protein
MKKPKYVSPKVLQKVPVEPEDKILAGSVADSTSVQTAGQEVVTQDFSGESFNHEWE